jgi:hypothetical protein
MKNLLLFEDFILESKKPGPKEYYTGLSQSTVAKRAAQIKKQTPMEDDDPTAYKKLPGDSKKTKPSKYTKKFAQMFNEDDNLDEGEGGPIRNQAIETALKNKLEKIKEKNSEKYKHVTIGILRSVMRRGMGAWKTGHRPGAGEEQWGYARVNSFLTGGKTIGTTANPGPDGDLGKRAKLI